MRRFLELAHRTCFSLELPDDEGALAIARKILQSTTGIVTVAGENGRQIGAVSIAEPSDPQRRLFKVLGTMQIDAVQQLVREMECMLRKR